MTVMTTYVCVGCAKGERRLRRGGSGRAKRLLLFAEVAR